MKERPEAELLEAKALELPQPVTIYGRVIGLLRRVAWLKIAIFFTSLFLFILAITLMKEGARDLAPLIRDRFNISNGANSLGFGWLFAYLIMSGSPVAASALAFFDAGIMNSYGTFTMIIGSRLGASFIVLFIGFLYVLRGRSRTESLSMGLLSLTVTGTTFAAALIIGVFLLQSGTLAGVELQSGGLLNSIADRVLDPVANFLLTFLPRWSLFLVGLGVILVSFNLFDRCLPEMTIRESHVGRVSRLVYRPWVMFLLGAGVTLISMSVSLSLSILVPLSQRGFVRRENVIPYIMGANITTFIDTLLAALLLNNPEAFTIIFAGMASITIVSIILLLIGYRAYERAMLALVSGVLSSNRNLALFMFAILLLPILLMLI